MFVAGVKGINSMTRKTRRQLLKDVFVVVLLASMLASALFLGIVKPYLDRIVSELTEEQWHCVENCEVNTIDRQINDLGAMYYNTSTDALEIIGISEPYYIGFSNTPDVNGNDELLQPAYSINHYQNVNKQPIQGAK